MDYKIITTTTSNFFKKNPKNIFFESDFKLNNKPLKRVKNNVFFFFFFFFKMKKNINKLFPLKLKKSNFKFLNH